MRIFPTKSLKIVIFKIPIFATKICYKPKNFTNTLDPIPMLDCLNCEQEQVSDCSHEEMKRMFLSGSNRS